MIIWTDSANETLKRHVESIRPTLISGGVDPDLMLTKLRQKIEAGLERQGGATVGREDVERVLRGEETDSRAIPATEPGLPPTKSRYAEPILVWGGRAFSLIFGVVLPLAALVIEMLSGMAAEMFDPIPTLWHVAAIALVIAANGLSIRGALTTGVSPLFLRRVAWLNAIATGIAAYYALWFIPMTPFAAVGILFFGIGLLPLSPLCSFVVALLLRRGLLRASARVGFRLPKLWWGLVGGFALMVSLELPGAFQAWALNAAMDGEPKSQMRSLWFLRHFGSEEQLLRGCYANPDAERTSVFASIFGSTSLTQRQQIYYRVTGRSFNSVPAPSHTLMLFGRGSDRGSQEWVWDDSQGGGQVGQRLKALYLKESRIDGTLDGNSAAGNLEWTMVFRNDHEFQAREARAIVELPAGAVVSRLTLWIDGEEREAAFGGRSEARQAYQAVVNQRRDPVLVTTKGPGRVLIQCFPVPAKGGEMKVRIGMTVPLVVDQLDSARLGLPRIVEQNFSATAGFSHTIWVEAKSALTSPSAFYRKEAAQSSASFALRGILTPAQFASPDASITVTRNPKIAHTWSRDARDGTHAIAQEILLQAPAAGPLSVVIDGSNAMQTSASALADVLDVLPANFSLTMRIAGDDVLTCPVQTAHEVAAWLRHQPFVGGQDSSGALRNAADSLGAPGGTLLWIHGTQPAAWNDTAALEQILTRRAGSVHLLVVSAVPGANVLLEQLGGYAELDVLPRLGGIAEDFTRIFQQLRTGGFAAVRHAEALDKISNEGPEAPTFLASLWAADEVNRLMSGKHPQREAAIRLATRARLVTPVTGAVVLETKQQYDAAGLTPGDGDANAVTVPETTSTLTLLVITIATVIFIARSGKRSLNRPGLGKRAAVTSR